MHRNTEEEQNKDVYKVFWKPGDENCICSQSGGLHKAYGRGDKAGQGRQARGFLGACVSGDADGPRWQTVA